MIRKIDAMVLFVDDWEQCVKFYRDTLGFRVTFTDDVSVAFKLDDNQDFVVLKVSAAVDMVGEEALSLRQGVAHRVLMCAGVEDIDAAYQAYMAKGITFIKPPVSQPWGRRTAYFADPDGNLWELWQSIEEQK